VWDVRAVHKVGGARPRRPAAGSDRPAPSHAIPTHKRETAPALRATTSGPIAARHLHPPGDSAVDDVVQADRGDRPLSSSVAPPSEATVAIERLGACSDLSTHAFEQTPHP
jgi:hypothetical protein